jgi:tRNA-splicing ligase RtcB (3'-phosphate/5'-hydroxy nucleic acid ligase)
MQQVIKGKYPAKIWTDYVEPEAKAQIENIISMPFIHKHVAIMPDVHAGVGATIGSVIPTVGAIIPSAVGVDIGCGLVAVPTSLTASDLPDSLKSLRLDIEQAVPVGFSAHEDHSHLNNSELHFIDKGTIWPIHSKYNIKERKQSEVQQAGTLGGGNHFIELCLDENQQVWVMLHSGSRGIGNAIGTKFIELARKDMERHFINLPDKDLAYLVEGSEHFDDYITAVEWAQQYAAMNRKVMLRLVVGVLKKHFPQIEVDLENRAVNCHHNYISREHHFGKNSIVTRKGAVSARVGQLGIIPGSMGTRSYIVEGLGNPESFNSCSHGAGRKMSRTKAKEVFTLSEHEEATKGVECRKDDGVIDETPGAYKDIDQVMEFQKDLVRPIHTLKQFLCVKG